jgi:hypothetical protein
MSGETQSIIVYRNPLEKALWESDAVAYIAGGFAAVLALILIGTLLNAAYLEVKRKLQRRKF